MSLFCLRSAQMCKRLLKTYNPNQPRDERGRWVDGGGPTGRFTTTGEGLALTSAGKSMLLALRSIAPPLQYKRSSEGQGVRIDGGPWRRVSLKTAGYDAVDEHTLYTMHVLRTRDLIRLDGKGTVLVRMVDQRDWWNP